MTGVDRIAVERARQLAPKSAGGEGWTVEHDRGHGEELAAAAGCYALPVDERRMDVYEPVPESWPWPAEWWKPRPGDRIRELEKAGALIAAAIDSMQDEAS